MKQYILILTYIYRLFIWYNKNIIYLFLNFGVTICNSEQWTFYITKCIAQILLCY